MTKRQIRSTNSYELTADNGLTVVLVSYQTPVAARSHGRYYRTSQRYSVTTSRQINQWLEGIKAEAKPEEWFRQLVREIQAGEWANQAGTGKTYPKILAFTSEEL